jgi:hypothetical protein
MMRTRVGAARRDITPDFAVPLGGFGQRVTLSEGVRDPVEVTALCVGNDDPVIVITADLIATAAPVRAAVVARLEAELGLRPERVVMTATHSHSAPVPHDPSGASEENARFTALLVDSTVAAVTEALSTRRDANLVSAKGNARIGFNRWRPDSADMVDERIPVVVAIDASTGAPIAVLFGAGCHPTTLGWDNMLVSADYPGVAKRIVRENFPGAVAMFVNTTEGDVVPATSARRDALDPRGYMGHDGRATEATGRLLADEVIRVARRITTAPLDDRHGRVAVAMADIPVAANTGRFDDAEAEALLARSTAVLSAHLGDGFETRVPPSRLWAESSRVVVEADMSDDEMREVMVACCYHLGLTARKARGAGPHTVTAPLQVVTLDRMQLLVMPGEVLVALGQRWVELTGSDDAFVVGLGNAHLRYLPMRHHFEEHGADRRYETITAGIAPGETDRLLEEGSALLASAR